MSGKFLRLSTLSLLYFVQGAPYGFQTGCLPLVLREAGLSFTSLGVMKLLFLPWICKPLYAPLMEKTQSKKWWLTLSMMSLAWTCFAASFLSSKEDLLTLSILMLLLNFFSASQDVSTDSLAVMILPENELGMGNTVQVVAYKAGSVFAGGLLLYCDEIWGWSGMFLAFGSLYIIGLVLLHCFKLVEKSSAHVKDRDRDNHAEKHNLNWSKIAEEVISVPGTKFMLLFVLFYKLCERAEQTFSLYMVDKHVPKSQMALWSTIMRTFSLAGSSYGGLALSGRSSKINSFVVTFSLLRSLPIVAQFVILCLWGPDPVLDPDVTFSNWNSDTLYMYSGFVCTSLTLFCAGVITTATFTYMMKLSQTAPSTIQGTHYTTLATCEVLGKLIFASMAGVLIDSFGINVIYFIFIILALACVPLAYLMPNFMPSNCRH